MKKIIFTFTLFTFLSSFTFAADNDDNKKLLKDLSMVIKNTDNIKWTNGDTYYKAAFSFNKQQVTAYYDSPNGELIGYFMHQNVMNKEVAEVVQKKYNDWLITDVVKFINAKGDLYYFAEIRNLKHTDLIEVTPKGRVNFFTRLH